MGTVDFRMPGARVERAGWPGYQPGFILSRLSLASGGCLVTCVRVTAVTYMLLRWCRVYRVARSEWPVEYPALRRCPSLDPALRRAVPKPGAHGRAVSLCASNEVGSLAVFRRGLTFNSALKRRDLRWLVSAPACTPVGFRSSPRIPPVRLLPLSGPSPSLG